MTPEILRDMNGPCLMETYDSIQAVITQDMRAAADLEPEAMVEEFEQILRYARVRKDPVMAEMRRRMDEMRRRMDDTAYLQGFLDRGEMLPAGTFTINRTLIARSSIIGHEDGTVITRSPEFVDGPAIRVESLAD